MAVPRLPQNADMYYFTFHHLEQLHDRLSQSRAILLFTQAWVNDGLSCSLNNHDRDLMAPVHCLLVELMEEMQSMLPEL